jgi:hypothetical protein
MLRRQCAGYLALQDSDLLFSYGRPTNSSRSLDLPMTWIKHLAVLSLVATCAVADTVIVPGAAWTDTSGQVIQAHGGGFLNVSVLEMRFQRYR